jgi:hypothetical protein
MPVVGREYVDGPVGVELLLAMDVELGVGFEAT